MRLSDPLAEGLAEEAYLFQTLLAMEEAPRNMTRFLARGGQTVAGELEVGALAGTLGQGMTPLPSAAPLYGDALSSSARRRV